MDEISSRPCMTSVDECMQARITRAHSFYLTRWLYITRVHIPNQMAASSTSYAAEARFLLVPTVEIYRRGIHYEGACFKINWTLWVRAKLGHFRKRQKYFGICNCDWIESPSVCRHRLPTAVWPNVKIKISPNNPKRCPKSNHTGFSWMYYISK